MLTFRTRSIGVNFAAKLKEIEAIMGGGLIFDTGPFFVRLRYMCKHSEIKKFELRLKSNGSQTQALHLQL